MLCPTCNASNAPDAVECTSCQAPLRRRPARRRDRSEEADWPFGVKPEGANLSALLAYRLSLFGLIPVAGLVLGPIAVVLGLLAAYWGRADSAFTARIPVTAAVVIGTIDALTNWGGVVLMWFGLASMLSS
jgi:hypothetical protein